MKNKISFFISILFLLSACSPYEKLLKSDNNEEKYKKAFECYYKKDYVKSSALFEQIASYYRGTSRGDSILYFYAKSYYYQGDYLMASSLFKTFATTYGRSDFAEEAEYMSCYCYYLMSPRPSLDQENTETAIQDMKMFLAKHPGSKYVPECKRLITEMRDKLIEKSYMNAKLYFDLSRYKASLIALRNSLNEYPDTKHREEIMFLIYKATYLLAYNSIPEKQKDRYQETLDDYYGFISEFPNSRLKKEVEKIHENTKEALGIDKTNKN
jgi:outer membrane protein assembly factor BamD